MAILVIAAIVRLLVAIAYRPALFYSDSWTYVDMGYAHHLADDRPAGYAVVLALLALPGRSLLVVSTLQHLAGLATGTLAYLMLRRLGVGRWLATAAAALILLDAYAITLEQTILAEAFFTLALVLSAFLVVGNRPSAWSIALGGLLLAAATVIRSAGVFAIPVWLIYVVLRHRVVRVPAVAAGAVLLPLLAYAAFYDHERGTFGLSAAQGWFLYGRVAEIADCSKFTPPSGTRFLCQTASEREGKGPRYYLWSGASPANRRFGVPGQHREADAPLGRFAKTVVKRQPLAYVGIVARDFGRYFEPGAGSGGESDTAISLAATPRTRAPTINEAFRAKYFPSYRPAVRTPDAIARGYAAVVHPPRPLLALLVLVTAAALALALVRRRRYAFPRWREAFLLTGMGVAMLLGSVATSAFVVRYLVPTVPLIVCGGTLAIANLIEARRATGRMF